MKKFCFILLLSLLLTGCAAQETFETISDDLDVPVAAQMGSIMLNMPQEAAATVMESEAGQLYLCGDYYITVQTLSGGDLDATLRSVTGYSRSVLPVMETERYGMDRYDFVWTSAGENGDQVGRGAVLSDGNYHYCVTVMGSADNYKENQDAWDSLLSSFYIN